MHFSSIAIGVGKAKWKQWFWVHFPKVFGPYAIIGLKITLHMNQENGHVYQLIPAAATGFQHFFDILENTVHLSFKVEMHKISSGIQLQSGNAV